MDHLSIDSKVDSLWDSFFEMDKQSPVDLQFQEENMEIQPAMNAVYTIYNCKPPNAMSIPPTFCFYDRSWGQPQFCPINE